MGYPYGQGDATQEVERVTALGDRLFRCRPCRRTFNERMGTPFNHLRVPTDSAFLVVLWRLRDKLSLRDLSEMALTRGFSFTHETVREGKGRSASPRWWLSACVPNGGAKRASDGTPTSCDTRSHV